MTSLTGHWRGVFSYPGDLAPVSFDAELRESNGAIVGLIQEVDDLGDGRGHVLQCSLVDGARRGSEVAFRKTYDDFDPVCMIDYFGKLDPEAVEIVVNGRGMKIQFQGRS